MSRKVITGFLGLGVALIFLIAVTFLINATKVNAAGDVARTYNSKCASCHGRDGRSKTLRGRRTHSRDLSSGEWQNDVSDERIYNSISNGKGKMPSFKKSLTDSQIDELVSYVRRLRK